MFTIATHITPNLMSYYIVMENCIYLNKSISVANVVNIVKKKTSSLSDICVFVRITTNGRSRLYVGTIGLKKIYINRTIGINICSKIEKKILLYAQQISIKIYKENVIPTCIASVLLVIFDQWNQFYPILGLI